MENKSKWFSCKWIQIDGIPFRRSIRNGVRGEQENEIPFECRCKWKRITKAAQRQIRGWVNIPFMLTKSIHFASFRCKNSFEKNRKRKFFAQNECELEKLCVSASILFIYSIKWKLKTFLSLSLSRSLWQMLMGCKFVWQIE